MVYSAKLQCYISVSDNNKFTFGFDKKIIFFELTPKRSVAKHPS
jgi:hypothetical protein